MSAPTYVIHPYYTGRDKGALSARGDTSGRPLEFDCPEAARAYLRDRGRDAYYIEHHVRIITKDAYYGTPERVFA